MTLHEAIIIVLKENVNAMTTKEIANELNTRKIYTKKDGTEIKPNQISARIRRYQHLFSKGGSLVSLVDNH